ncbi:MAG: serine hydrolase domain-containing protein [Geminicoccaceae bacterium]
MLDVFREAPTGLGRRNLLVGAAAAAFSATFPPLPASAAAKRRVSYFPPPESAGGWRRLVGTDQEPSPGERAEIRRLAGMDWPTLAEAFAFSESFGARSALLVIRRGWVAGEWGPTTPYFTASISKSLTGLAVARLFEVSRTIRWGKVLGPNTPAFELLPASFAARDARRRKIRLAHLLSMTSGLEPDDAPYRPDYGLERILDRPLLAEPGTVWAYCSATADLLGLAVQTRTGRSVSAFFNEEIGARIGMAPIAWDSSAGLDRACCAARVAARDLARIGWLLLAQGRWGTVGRDERILAPKTVRLLSRPSKLARRARFAPTPNSPFPIEPSSPLAYAKLWWTNATGTMLGPSVPRDAFYAHGFRENLLVVVPSLELVVVRLGFEPEVEPTFRRELMARVMAALVD